MANAMKTVLTLVVSAAVAARKCAPQITLRGIPAHKSGLNRSGSVTTTLKFTLKKDGEDVPAELFVADTHGVHASHQSGEVQQETFARVFAALSKFPGACRKIECEIVDGEGGNTSAAADNSELNEIFG